MKQNRWYMVTKDGAATLCVDEQDARDEAARRDQEWPRNAPHRAVQLVEASELANALGTPKAAQQASAGVTLRSMIEGMSVSVDVSTGDHDAGHRYFGTVTEVMECQGDKHGVTLLVQDAEPNFTATPAAPSTPQ